MTIKLLGFSFLLMALSAFGQEGLAEMKARANDHISNKISTLRAAQNCVGSAATAEAFKACKYDLRESMQMQKEEAKEEKKA